MNNIAIFDEMDRYIDRAMAMKHVPNVVLLGVEEWGYFTGALKSLAVDVPIGRPSKHRGLTVYPVNLPSHISVGIQII